MAITEDYLAKWRLKAFPSKTVSLVFHSRNHYASYYVQVEASPGKDLQVSEKSEII